ncbi:hypothetical protein FBU31_003419, partial [Coemansia sp. 'formosensis']
GLAPAARCQAMARSSTPLTALLASAEHTSRLSLTACVWRTAAISSRRLKKLLLVASRTWVGNT